MRNLLKTYGVPESTTPDRTPGHGAARAVLKPLCVDLDGTLVRTDTLWESIAVLLKNRPWIVLAFPFWLLRGRAQFKRQIASRAALDPALLPYREELVDYLRKQRAAGREIVMATAADELLARPIAEHLGLFDEVFASNGTGNLKGRHKCRQLVDRFGSGGFVYAGDSCADLPIWRSASSAVVAGENPKVTRRVREEVIPVERRFSETGSNRWRALLRLLRPHQWTKNMLVFVPLFLSHQFSGAALATSFLSVLCFTLCSAGVYALNDFLDVSSDRVHHSKRFRPLASGALPLWTAALAAPVLTVLAFTASLWLPPVHSVILGCYLLLTIAYSFKLKQILLADVFVLASLYTLRIIAGGAATGIEISFFTLAFSVFLFTSLALIKRYAELRPSAANAESRAPGRGYESSDLLILAALGAASGQVAVLVLTLYLNSPNASVLYHEPQWLWLVCPLLLYWISRMWMLAHRGKVKEDPVLFVARDRVSYLVGALILGILFVAR